MPVALLTAALLLNAVLFLRLANVHRYYKNHLRSLAVARETDVVIRQVLPAIATIRGEATEEGSRIDDPWRVIRNAGFAREIHPLLRDVLSSLSRSAIELDEAAQIVTEVRNAASGHLFFCSERPHPANFCGYEHLPTSLSEYRYRSARSPARRDHGCMV
jgi:hypothetical protein